MSKLHMMAGSVAGGSDPEAPRVSAYVILADGPKTRVFKVGGKRSAPEIEELGAATTLDLRRFQDDVKADLAGLGPLHAVEATWACDVIRVHLRKDLGL